MATVEIARTPNGAVRIKFSNQTTSKFILNAVNSSVYSNGTTNVTIQIGLGAELYSFNLADITTINGVAAPVTVEDTLLKIADEVFNTGA